MDSKKNINLNKGIGKPVVLWGLTGNNFFLFVGVIIFFLVITFIVGYINTMYLFGSTPVLIIIALVIKNRLENYEKEYGYNNLMRNLSSKNIYSYQKSYANEHFNV